jgi:hypothetical protein
LYLRAQTLTFSPQVRFLLHSAGSSIEERNNNGTTPLLRAAWAGQLHVVKYLLTECGSKVREKMSDHDRAARRAGYDHMD